MGICSLALCREGGGDCGLGVAGGDWAGFGDIRGGDQVMLRLPDLVSGLGGEGVGMCRTAELDNVKECGSPGGCCSCSP